VTAHQPRFGLNYLTSTQRKLYDMLVACYNADQSVEIGTKTRLALEADPPLAQASRTVARGLITHGLADYSPEGTYLLLSETGKREAGIPTRGRGYNALADILS
jgi:hypothetical protein